jgi:hypothetical protein
VTWINADVNMTHGITLSSGEDGQTVFSNSSISYLNGTTYVFQQEGEYTFADPATGINGTISVVEGATDDPLTNSSMPTVINRVASKLRTLEGILYPGDAVKRSEQ